MHLQAVYLCQRYLQSGFQILLLSPYGLTYADRKVFSKEADNIHNIICCEFCICKSCYHNLVTGFTNFMPTVSARFTGPLLKYREELCHMGINVFNLSSASTEVCSNTPTCAILGGELLGLFLFVPFKLHCVQDYTHLSLLICVYDQSRNNDI